MQRGMKRAQAMSKAGIEEDITRRERFGGGDGRAINRHSVRVYVHRGIEYVLDRNNSCVPPCYTLSEIRPGSGLSRDIPVGGLKYWGDDLSWTRAEAKAFEAMQSMSEE